MTNNVYAVKSMDPMAIGAWGFLSVALFVLIVIGAWKMFKKANEKEWKAIIPFYNYYTMIKLTWKVKFFWIILIVSIVACIAFSIILTVYLGQIDPVAAQNGNIAITGSAGTLAGVSVLFLFLSVAYGVFMVIMHIIFCARVSRAYGHGAGYTLGLLFFPYIFLLILGFGKSKYIGNVYRQINK